MPTSENFPLDHFINIPQPVHNTPDIPEMSVFEENPPPLRTPFPNTFNAQELDSTNNEIVEQLQNKIGKVKYKAYFNNTFSLISLSSHSITFAVPTEYIKTIIKDHYLPHIQDAVQQVLGKEYEIELAVTASGKGPIQKAASNSDPKKTSAKDASFTIDLMPTKQDKLSSINSKFINYPNNKKFRFIVDPKKTFDSFVVGPSNNMAFASAQAVTKDPGKIYPCLYLHSSSGLGKTHLLHSIANSIKGTYPSLVICITTARDFMTEMIDAIKDRNIFKFRKKYSEDIDVLMIDDIHELKNKEGTQNEFFHIFNELHNKGRQLVFTSDKRPKDIEKIEERIKTRLAWGLVLDIQPPDLETRIAILKKKAVEEDLFLPQDIINLIATRVRSSIRELEGSLVRLAAYSSVFGVDIDMEIAKEQLNLTDNQKQNAITFNTIIKGTSQYFTISPADIKSKARFKTTVQARHIAMFLCHTLINPTPTYMEIGAFFGGRNHTSVLHAVEKLRRALKTDQQLSQDLLEIENGL